MHPFDDRAVLREVLAAPGAARMIALTLAEVAELTGGALTGGPGAAVTGAVTLDSRTVAPGDLFVAVAGGAGRRARLPRRGRRGRRRRRAHHPPRRRAAVRRRDDPVDALGRLAAGVHARLAAGGLRTLAITGSSGKTSTKDLLGQVLAAAGPTVSPPGSYNNDIGLPLTVLSADEDTRFLVLEMGSRGPGHIARLCRVARPHVGVVLNVGSAHLGEFGSAEGIAQAKGELVEALPDDGTAVLNADDPRVLGMAPRTVARVVTTGRGEDADVRALGRRARRRRPRPVHPGRRRRGAPGGAAGRRRAPGGQRPVGRRRRPGRGHDAGRRRRRAVGRRLAQPLAHGGAAARRRRHRRQRRLQRQPRVDAGRAGRAAPGCPAPGGSPSWGRWPSSAPTPRPSTSGWAATPRRPGIDLVVAVGPDAVGIADGAAAAGRRAGEESVHVPDRAAARELLSEVLRPGDVVLVKASRSYGLELLAADLLDRRGRRVRSVLIAAGFGLILSILLTPVAIRAFRRQGMGQEIRDDGPESHLSKKGTPTMGGTVIVGATVVGYVVAAPVPHQPGRAGASPPPASCCCS